LRRRPRNSSVTIGESLIDAVAVTVQHRTVDEQKTPTLGPLKALSPRYLARKVRQGYSSRIGVRTGRMLDVNEVKGETYVGRSVAVMTFGREEEIKQRAEFFQERGRPFYELGPREEKAVAAVIDETAEQQRRALGF
jgi:hypothetical protein